MRKMVQKMRRNGTNCQFLLSEGAYFSTYYRAPENLFFEEMDRHE